MKIFKHSHVINTFVMILAISLVVFMTPLLDLSKVYADDGATVLTADMIEWEPNDDGDNTCSIIGYKSSFPGGNVVIPRNLRVGNTSYSVTEIGPSTFYSCTILTEISIPESVKRIGTKAFQGCSGLTSIEIPDSVTSIGSSAFQGCKNLTSIEIPDSVTDIGDSTFRYCYQLESVTIPDSVSSLGSYAFGSCTSLTSIEIPDSVTSIGSHAFYGCKLLANVSMSSNITSIENDSFEDCSKLTLAVVTPGMTTVPVGKIQQMEVHYWHPENNIYMIGWESTNTEVVKVTAGGWVHSTENPEPKTEAKITAKKAGYAEVYARIWKNNNTRYESTRTIVTVPQNVSVRYNANGGENAPETQSKQYGEPLTLSTDVPTREGFVFRGWSSVQDGSVEYRPGDEYTEEEHITLYAVWVDATNHDHEYDAGVVTLEPTCTEDGEKVFTCQICGYERHDIIEALGHDWNGGEITKEATCEEDGVKIYTCQNDPSHTRTEVLPGGHDLEKISANEATCTEDGNIEYWHCKKCDKLFDAEEAVNEIAASDTVVEASGHDWNEGQITKEVTCEEDGVKTFTCQNDPSHIRTESISSPGHNYNEGEITTEPTCTTEGEKTLTCQTCGDVKTETIDALGHDWNNGRVTKEATCEEDGVKTFTCGHDSSHTRTEAIPATGHDYDEGEITREPTCTTNGVKTFTCRNCGDSYAVSVPALGHDWNSGKVTKEATCEEDGIRTFTCKHDSSHTRTEVIPASHLLNKTNAVAATCTKDGNIEYWQCEKCDGLFADEDAQSELSASDIVVKATGHDWNDGVVTKEATCDEDGVKTFTCQNDPSHTRTEIIPGGHELTHVPETAATCTKKGNIEHWKCETCNKCFTDEDADNEIAAAETAVAALGHDWNNGRVTREATCEEDGTKTFTCKHDSSHTRTETIPATGHDLEKNEANAATCVKEGNIEYWECSLCGTLFSDEEGTKVIEPEDTVTAVTDHTYGEWTVTEEPTCTEQGVREKVCGVCGDRITEVIPSKGHDWDNDYTIDKAATCTENGSKSIHCSNCDAVKNQKTIEAVGHDWDNGRIIKEATCEEDGVKLYTCTNDPSHTKDEEVEIHGPKTLCFSIDIENMNGKLVHEA